MGFAIVILSIAIGFLLIERIIIRRSVTALHLRIHVNGTRGKSSVTKYIAAGLLSTDPAVMAKVTGVIPSLISSGIVKVLGRSGVARVQEQFNIIRLAARKGIKKLVLESMSITPELQQLESRVFKPHFYVITNIKDDHREHMGISLREQAESICNAIPASCTVVTNEIRFLDLIKKKAEAMGSTVVVPLIDEIPVSTDLPYGVFVENMALALTVCELAGMDYNTTLKAVLGSIEDEDSPHQIIKAGAGELNFLNAFTVNDVDSTESFIEYWKEKIDSGQKFSIIFNTRSDRPLRTDSFAAWIGEKSEEIDKVILLGDHRDRALRKLKRSGIDRNNILVLGRRSLKGLRSIISDIVPEGSLIVGLGNIGGYGNIIMEELI